MENKKIHKPNIIDILAISLIFNGIFFREFIKKYFFRNFIILE